MKEPAKPVTSPVDAGILVAHGRNRLRHTSQYQLISEQLGLTRTWCRELRPEACPENMRSKVSLGGTRLAYQFAMGDRTPHAARPTTAVMLPAVSTRTTLSCASQ